MIRSFFFVTILSLSLAADASFYKSYFAPLKIYTCAQMLGPLSKYSKSNSAIPALRMAIEKLKVRSRQPDTGVESAYSNMHYNGDLSSLPQRKAAALQQRLTAIENNMQWSNLETQIITVEIRGLDVNKALNELPGTEADVHDAFWAAVPRANLYKYRAAMLAFDSMLVLLPATLIIHPNPFSLVGTIVSLPVGAGVLRYQYERFDWRYLALKSTLQNLVTYRNPNLFFMDSTAIVVPVEFHEALVNGQIDRASQLKALENWTSSIVARGVRRTIVQYGSGRLAQDMSRLSRRAGEHEHVVYLDNIAYYDSDAAEPVWLYFYRALKGRH